METHAAVSRSLPKLSSIDLNLLLALEALLHAGSVTAAGRRIGLSQPAMSHALLIRLDDRTVFIGDLVYAGMHAYLADGFASEWLACLDRLERELAPDVTLYVGHGAPAGLHLIDQQRRYVQAFIASVERHLRSDPEPRRAAVVADMKKHLPTEDLAFLMELSVDPFAAKLEASRNQA